MDWIKKNGLTSMLIAAIFGLYGFFVENRIERRFHEQEHINFKDEIHELQYDIKMMPKRILDEVRARQHLIKLNEMGAVRDTMAGIIDIPN
jgi:hypothetical protein